MYGVLLFARSPAMDESVMMEPPPPFFISGMAYLEVRTMLLTFTAMMWSHCSSVTSVTSARVEMPTLLWTMSSRP